MNYTWMVNILHYAVIVGGYEKKVWFSATQSREDEKVQIQMEEIQMSCNKREVKLTKTNKVNLIFCSDEKLVLLEIAPVWLQ